MSETAPVVRRLTFIGLCLFGVAITIAAGFVLMVLTTQQNEDSPFVELASDDAGYVVLFPENKEMMSVLDKEFAAGQEHSFSADDIDALTVIEPAAGNTSVPDIMPVSAK